MLTVIACGRCALVVGPSPLRMHCLLIVFNLSQIGISWFSQLTVHRDVLAPMKVWWGPIQRVSGRVRVDGVHLCDKPRLFAELGPHCLTGQ